VVKEEIIDEDQEEPTVPSKKAKSTHQKTEISADDDDEWASKPKLQKQVKHEAPKRNRAQKAAKNDADNFDDSSNDADEVEDSEMLLRKADNALRRANRM
jgi:hypothetical protein